MTHHEEMKVYFRNSFVHFSEAKLSILNSGFLYGLGVFTGMRAHMNPETKQLYLFRPEQHFERLKKSCKLLRFEHFLKSYDYPTFSKIVLDLLRMNDIHEDVYLRVSNFSDENKITPKLQEYKDSLAIAIYRLGDYIPTKGLKCIVSSWTRNEDNALPSRVKCHGSYVNTALAKSEAVKRGCDEALFLDSRGHVVEGSAENIFMVRDGTLITPPLSDNILEGITRRSVIEIAAAEGIPLIERSIDRSELYFAEEIFLTGTGARVSPVVEVDAYQVGDGTVGPISKRLQSLYDLVVRGGDARFLSWVQPVHEGK